MTGVSPERILVSNDDGIHASGIGILETIARELSDDIWVVAPETEKSGAGHSLTLTEPLRVRQLEEKRFAVSGTPTDCVLMAVAELIQDKKPTLLLSGVNRGANLAEDVTYSGTVAAAMEGTLCGIPSIALSQVIDFQKEGLTDWSVAATHGRHRPLGLSGVCGRPFRGFGRLTSLISSNSRIRGVFLTIGSDPGG